MHQKLLTTLLAILLLGACTQTTPANEEATEPMVDTEQRNKDVVKECLEEGIMKGNLDVLTNNMADEVTEYGDGSTPPVSNKDSIRWMLKEWLNAFPNPTAKNMIYVADGDYVMAYGEWTGTFQNDFIGMKANGKSFNVPDVDIFKLNEEGKVTEHRTVQSSATMMMQLGVEPPKDM